MPGARVERARQRLLNPAAPEAAAAAEEAATAAGTAAAGESLSALAIAGRVAVVAVETVVLAVLAFALEYLRRKAEAERFRAKMKAAQPEIETAVSALDPEIEALQRSSSGRTVWVHVTIWITSRDTVMGGMGFMTYDHAFEDAGFERASASLQYVNGRTSTLGRPVSVPFEGGSATSTLRRELVTTSVPVAYNTATLDAAERLHRIQRIEADAKQPDLPSSVLQALFNERDAMKSAGLP